MTSMWMAAQPPLGTMDYDSQDPAEMTGSSRPQPAPFVFPARRSMDHASDYVPPPLPSFSFNPGNIHAPSPSTSAITASRPAGHRRRHSELIGGEGPPSPSMLSSSPVKPDIPTSESSAQLPSGVGVPPRGPGRRGHAHRRSGAMSSMDLSAMTQAVPQTLVVGSAPVTPADMRHNHAFHDDLALPMSRSATSLHQPTPPASPTKHPVALYPAHRNTIAFDERPRPLSMVSNDTSSSLSTMRPTHSRVNSATPSTRIEPSSPPLPRVRPKTADASMLLSQASDHLSTADLPFLRSVSGPNSPNPIPTFDAQEPHPSPYSKDDKKKKQKKKATRYYAEDHHGAVEMTRDSSGDKWESASSTHSRDGEEKGGFHKPRKSQKKQKKVRSWAGAIFPLKSKRTHVKKPLSRRSPTPPPIFTRTNSDMGVDFDDDNTVVIRTPTNSNAPKPPPGNMEMTMDTTFEASWKPRSFYEQNVENDAFSPVIDLDAALGPFNTPEMSSGHVAGSAFSQATKRMYSGGRRGEFVGPEMRYHRRAESAPEMPPFDRSALGFPRVGSNSTMAHADVFYEEEEDAFLAGSQSPAGRKSSATANDAVEGHQKSSSETLDTILPIPVRSKDPVDDGLGIQVTADDTVDGPGDAIINELPGDIPMRSPRFQTKKSVEIIETDDWRPRIPSIPSPDVSPHMLAIEKRPCSSPVDFSAIIPQLTLPPQHSSSSAFPSPDPSNMSFDGPRSATASSFNQPFHDQFQGSVEDVPSLSSSASTKTNNRGRFSSSFYMRSSGERSASFSTPLPPRTSPSSTAKRASLVSLSRLVGGSYGEKSKLRYEEKPPPDDTEGIRKTNRRISRLMFWKSKDKQKAKGVCD